LLRVLLQKNNHCREEHSCTLAKKIQARAMVPKHFIPAYSRMLHLKKKIYMMAIWPTLQTNRREKTMYTRDVVLTKRCGNAPKKLPILKLFQIYFKAKHGKGMGTPFPRDPASLHPWWTHPDRYGLKICEKSTYSAGSKDIHGTMWLFLMSTHLVHPCTPHQVGTTLKNYCTPRGVRYTRLTSSGLDQSLWVAKILPTRQRVCC